MDVSMYVCGWMDVSLDRWLEGWRGVWVDGRIGGRNCRIVFPVLMFSLSIFLSAIFDDAYSWNLSNGTLRQEIACSVPKLDI